MTKNKAKATPKSIAKNVANPLDGIVKRAIDKGWRVTVPSGTRHAVILSNRPDGEV